MVKTTRKKLPGVLSFQRGIALTDALFFNLMPDGTEQPLWVIRHGIRGTQNINKSTTTDGSTAASAKRSQVSNPQTTDSAKLHPSATALRVRFNIRHLPLEQALFACAPSRSDSDADILGMRAGIAAFISRARDSKGLDEIASRYARNIANGRFLWRNRAVAEKVTVSVRLPNTDEVLFDALDIDLRSFGSYTGDERRIAEVIGSGMRGNSQAGLTVVATVDFGVGGGVEVFPSQNYIENKDRGFARPLYFVGDSPAGQDDRNAPALGQAALRDQKVSNALRTFDTWYSGFEKTGTPIPIEPMGANLDAQTFYRPGAPDSAFSKMLRIEDIDPDTDEGMFMIGCLIRGGVYSGSESTSGAKA